MGMLVSKRSGHTLSLITLLAIPPWSRKPLFLVGSPRVITLGQILCNTWSTRPSLALETTRMGVQGTTKARAGPQKQRMCRCLDNRSRSREGVSTFTEARALPES